MPRSSTKSNKTVYQLKREELGLSREKASELLEYIPAGRIEKIENEKQNAQPADVLAMARVYQKPELCNYYCTHECPIGKESMQEIPGVTAVTCRSMPSCNLVRPSTITLSLSVMPLVII